MADKKSCLNYKLAIAKLAFWDGDIRCESCACMETYARKQCRLTGEYLGDTRGRGHICPLIPVDSDEWSSPESLVEAGKSD
mgnify:CR=1 FL=1|jgi:hypothetical protein|nr:MAG TPA: zinc finger Ran-binding domain-containing protein [Caudoviricetes sp.]